MATIPINNMTDTWNNSGTVFSSIKMNVTNTASAAGSALLNLQVGGVSQLAHYPNASTLELGNSTTATAFHVYNTVDTLGAPTNYERGVFDWQTTANVLTIGTQAGGTGSNRSVSFLSAAASYTFTNGGGVQGYLQSGIWQLAGSGGAYGFTSTNQANGTLDTTISRVTAQVIKIGDISFNTNGWLNWGGEQRTTAATTYTSNTTLSTILTANLQAGRTYSFDLYIPITASFSTGGLKVALAGTATWTAVQIDSWFVSNNALTNQVQFTSTTLGNLSNGLAGAATGCCRAQGTLTCNAAGTLLVQTAQNTSSATATVVAQGARLIMNDMP